jgi:hypothetical protein
VPLLGLDVLVEAHALLRYHALVGDDFLFVQRDLVLLLGELRAGRRVADVRVGDRLALDAHLLAADGHGLRDLVGDNVHAHAHAHAAALALRRPGGHLLLGARHRVGGFAAADVVADDTGRAVRRRIGVTDRRARVAAGALGEPGV